MRVRDILPAFLLALLLLCPGASAQAQTGEADFTRQMAERFRTAFPGHSVEVTEPLQLRIGLTPEPITVNVGRLYNFCASATAQDCESTINHFVAGSVEGFTRLGTPITGAQLRLLVRNIEYCSDLRQAQPPGQPGPIIHPFVPGLCTILMADFPTSMRSVTVAQLQAMGLEPDDAWALAERQTLATLPRPEALEELHDGVALLTGYDYLTSLMLNADGWRAAAAREGELLVAIPASNEMIVVRRANVRDLDNLRSAVRDDMHTAERGISPNIYRWTATGWALLE